MGLFAGLEQNNTHFSLSADIGGATSPGSLTAHTTATITAPGTSLIAKRACMAVSRLPIAGCLSSSVVMLTACHTDLHAEIFGSMSEHPPPFRLVGAVSLSSAITHMAGSVAVGVSAMGCVGYVNPLDPAR